MIIQCPKCGTKFSLENSVVCSVTNPRFHCSRCDHLFRETENAVNHEAMEEIAVDQVTAEGDETISDAAAASSTQLELLPVADRTSALATPYRNSRLLSTDQGQDFEEGLPFVTADWPDTSINKPFSADMRGVRRAEPAEPTKPFYKYNGNGQREPDRQARVELEKANEQSPQQQRAKQVGLPSQQAHTPLGFSDFEADDSLATAKPSVLHKTPVAWGFLRPVAFVSSAPLLIVLTLLVASYFLTLRQEVIPRLFSLADYVAPTSPPQGVSLVNLRSEFITLENGKRVLEISGMLTNGSERLLQDVKLEARLFDRNNLPLSALLVAQNNALMNAAGVNALQEDVLISLQQQLDARNAVIKPHDSVRIRIVLTEQLDTASYFIARVYTVRALA